MELAPLELEFLEKFRSLSGFNRYRILGRIEYLIEQEEEERRKNIEMSCCESIASIEK